MLSNSKFNADTPMPDSPRLGEFMILHLMLAKEQRGEYVKFKEDDEGNIL
jgi:hypothetical protein